MTIADFLAEFQGRVHRFGSRPLLPSEVLGSWEQLIQQCEESYQWNIYEYMNDLAIRDWIESLFESVTLSQMEEFEWFRAATLKLDRRFHELLKSGPRIRSEDAPWWRTRLPPYAGNELVEDARDRYGVEIEERE